MMFADCASIESDLGPFVDGELRGPKVLAILQHVERCPNCAAEVDAMRQLGEALRTAAPADPDAPAWDGLASTVISRTRAEADESWYSVLRRGGEDWHWVIVGAGSFAATVVSTTVLSAILAFGPRPERGDSLSALIRNSEMPVDAVPAYFDHEAMYLMFDDIGPMASRGETQLARRVVDESEESLTELEVVDELLARVAPKGRPVEFERMGAKERRRTEALLERMNQLRFSRLVPISATVGTLQVRFSASTSVRGL